MVAVAGFEVAPGVTRVAVPAEVTALEEVLEELGRIDGTVDVHAVDTDAVRIDQLDRLERLKAAADPRPGHHLIEVTTPTGHHYRSSPPSALGP